MKSQPQDSESVQPLSFGEILKSKEKVLQQEQEANASSAAVAMAAVQIPSIGMPILDLSIRDQGENADKPEDSQSSAGSESSYARTDPKMSLTDSQFRGMPVNATSVHFASVTAPTETEGEDQGTAAEDLAPTQTHPIEPAVSRSDLAFPYSPETTGQSNLPTVTHKVQLPQNGPMEDLRPATRVMTNIESSAGATNAAPSGAAKLPGMETLSGDNARLTQGLTAPRRTPEVLSQPATKQTNNLPVSLNTIESPVNPAKPFVNIVKATENPGPGMSTPASIASFQAPADKLVSLANINLPTQSFNPEETVEKVDTVEQNTSDSVSEIPTKVNKDTASVGVKTTGHPVKAPASSSHVDAYNETSSISAQPQPLSGSSSIRSSAEWTLVEAEAFTDTNPSLGPVQPPVAEVGKAKNQFADTIQKTQQVSVEEVSASFVRDTDDAETQKDARHATTPAEETDLAARQSVKYQVTAQPGANSEEVVVEAEKAGMHENVTVGSREEPLIHQSVTQDRQIVREILISSTRIDSEPNAFTAHVVDAESLPILAEYLPTEQRVNQKSVTTPGKNVQMQSAGEVYKSTNPSAEESLEPKQVSIDEALISSVESTAVAGTQKDARYQFANDPAAPQLGWNQEDFRFETEKPGMQADGTVIDTEDAAIHQTGAKNKQTSSPEITASKTVADFRVRESFTKLVGDAKPAAMSNLASVATSPSEAEGNRGNVSASGQNAEIEPGGSKPQRRDLYSANQAEEALTDSQVSAHTTIEQVLVELEESDINEDRLGSASLPEIQLTDDQQPIGRPIDSTAFDDEASQSADYPSSIHESRVVEQQLRVSMPDSADVQTVSYPQASTAEPITTDDTQIPSEPNKASSLVDTNSEDATFEAKKSGTLNNPFLRAVESPQPEFKESAAAKYSSEAYDLRAPAELEKQTVTFENEMAVAQDRSAVDSTSAQPRIENQGIKVDTEANVQANPSLPTTVGLVANEQNVVQPTETAQKSSSPVVTDPENIPMASHPIESFAHSMVDNAVRVPVETKETVVATEANSEMPAESSPSAINTDTENATVRTKQAIAQGENPGWIAETVELDVRASVASEDFSETKNEAEFGGTKTQVFVSTEKTSTPQNPSKIDPAFVQKANTPEQASIEMEAVDSQVSVSSTAASTATAEMGTANEDIEGWGEPAIRANTARTKATQSAFEIQHGPTAETQNRVTAESKNAKAEVNMPTPVVDRSQLNSDIHVTQMTSLQESTDPETKAVNTQPAAETESPAINNSDLPKVVGALPATKGETLIVEVEDDVKHVKGTMKGLDPEKFYSTEEGRLSIENQRLSTETLEPAVFTVNSPSEPLQVSFERGSTIQIDPQAAEVVKQVVQHLNGKLKSGPATMHLQLNPEEWGAIEVEIIRDSQGISVTFFAEQASTGKLLETQLGQLRQSLVDSGVQLSGLNIGQHNSFRQEGGSPNQSTNFAQHASRQREALQSQVDAKEGLRPERLTGQMSEVDYLI